jgi:hypothetical protein
MTVLGGQYLDTPYWTWFSHRNRTHKNASKAQEKYLKRGGGSSTAKVPQVPLSINFIDAEVFEVFGLFSVNFIFFGERSACVGWPKASSTWVNCCLSAGGRYLEDKLSARGRPPGDKLSVGGRRLGERPTGSRGRFVTGPGARCSS